MHLQRCPTQPHMLNARSVQPCRCTRVPSSLLQRPNSLRAATASRDTRSGSSSSSSGWRAVCVRAAASGASGSSSSSAPLPPPPTQQQQQQPSAADYLSPFSAVDPALDVGRGVGAAGGGEAPPVADSSSSSSAGAGMQDSPPPPGVDADRWGDVLATKHTLSSLYLQRFKVEPVQERDWEAKRRKSDLAEVCQAGAKLAIDATLIQDNLAQLQGLVPGLLINLDRMKASDWAKLLARVDAVVAVVIALKGHYPRVDVAAVLARKPRLLLASADRINEDAAEVKALLSSKVQDVDAIIAAVPDLMCPQQLRQSLANLTAWFPAQDPYELLQTNPAILEAPNVEADPTYGEITTAG